MDVKTAVALALSTLLSLRMVLWLIDPNKHKGIALGLYSADSVWIKRLIYFGLFVYLSYLIISKGSIVDYVISLFAIGSLFDYFFTYFRYPRKIIQTNHNGTKYGYIQIPALTPIRYYIALPLIFVTLWLYYFVFLK